MRRLMNYSNIYSLYRRMGISFDFLLRFYKILFLI